MFKRKRKSGGQQIGCGFLLGTGIGLVTLFLINNGIVKLLFNADLQDSDERFFQATQFMLPIGMLFVEYLFIDRMIMTFKKIRGGKSDELD